MLGNGQRNGAAKGQSRLCIRQDYRSGPVRAGNQPADIAVPPPPASTDPARWLTVCVATLGCLGTQPAAAEDLALYQASGLFNQTADGYQRWEAAVDYRNHRRDFFWPWEEAETDGLDWGVNAKYLSGTVDAARFRGTRVLGVLGWRYSTRVYFEGGLGAHQLRTDDADHETLGIYTLNAHYTPWAPLSLLFEASKDYVYPENVLPGGITQYLTARTEAMSTTWHATPRVRATLRARLRDFSDNNRQDQYTGALLYGISPDTPWVWIGIGGEHMGYDMQRPDYWSPRYYSSYGLRWESDFPLGARVTASLGLNLDRVHEDGVASNGQYYAFGLDTRISANLVLRLNASRVNSIQSGSRWHENTYGLSLAGSLL
jgi:hypothetical protein